MCRAMFTRARLSHVQSGTATLVKSCESLEKKLSNKLGLSELGKAAVENLRDTIEEVKDMKRPLDRAMQLRKNQSGNPVTAKDFHMFAHRNYMHNYMDRS